MDQSASSAVLELRDLPDRHSSTHEDRIDIVSAEDDIGHNGHTLPPVDGAALL